jgi:hypothetical protein
MGTHTPNITYDVTSIVSLRQMTSFWTIRYRRLQKRLSLSDHASVWWYTHYSISWTAKRLSPSDHQCGGTHRLIWSLLLTTEYPHISWHCPYGLNSGLSTSLLTFLHLIFRIVSAISNQITPYYHMTTTPIWLQTYTTVHCKL